MDLLSRCTDGNLLQRALFHLPESLNDAYGESMTRLVSQNPFASRCLYWTLYACRPLTVAELKFAASFEPLGSPKTNGNVSSEHNILHETAGLLTIDHMTGRVHLVHKTAKEYLSGPAARVFFPTAMKHIADTCLTIITPDEVIDECYMSNGANPRKPLGDLLDYATAYWGHHAREVGEDEQTTQVLIRAFLNKLCWRRPPPVDDASPDLQIPEQLGLGCYSTDWSALHVLAYFGITGKAKRLIEQGANVDENDNCLGITPLHCAVHQGQEEMVELLLEHKANINATCKKGNSALHMAASKGHRKIIRILLYQRINSRTVNHQGETALQLAVGTKHDEGTVPLLIKSRFDMDVQNPLTGNTALHLAVELKRSRIILFLLEKGASMNILNRDGLTPLQLACKLDNCGAASFLLERGAKVENRSSRGDTALHVCATEGNWVALDLLVAAGADPNAWDSEGQSLLHKEARKASTVAIAAHLLQKGANIEARSIQGHTALQCAALSGNKLMFAYLMGQGAKLYVHTAKGETLLHIIPPLNQNYLDILAIILELNFNPNTTTVTGLTPLHHLIIDHVRSSDPFSDKTIDYISLLLSHGANIDAQLFSQKAETALHLAVTAKMPHESLILFLLKSGASVNAKTTEGKTALHLAAERGRHNLFKILLDHGADISIKVPTDAPDKDGPSEEGLTALDLAQKNPVGMLWFDEKGKLGSVSDDLQASSITPIDDLEIGSELDDMAGSTLVGDEGSTWDSKTSTAAYTDHPSVVSLS